MENEEEIFNGEYYAAKIELNGEDGYIDAYGMIQDAPDGDTECATIADAEELVEKFRYSLPEDAEYSVVSVTQVLKVKHSIYIN